MANVNKAAFTASIFKRGQKAEKFDDAEEADELVELQGKLGELHAIWALERTGKDLAAAIWRPELGVAEVVLMKGKLLSHMGFTRGSKLYLFIEEAVYLVDRANLLLFLDQAQGQGRQQQRQQRLLSLQEAYELMQVAGVPMDRYLAFCKLLRAGYIVQRHPARWVLRPAEDPRQVWVGWSQPPTSTGPATAAAAAPPPPPVAAPQLPPPGAGGAEGALPSSTAPKRRRVEQQQQHSGSWWVAGAAAGQLPQQPTGSASVQGGPTDTDGDAAAAGGCSGSGSNPWLRGMPAGFLDSLPRVPVVPDAAQRAAADFPRMSPLPPIPLEELRPLGGPQAGRHLLHYDVYNANSKFSRKQPGPPACVVSVAPCTRLPTPEDMAAADAAAGTTPVRFCAVEKGDIAFYGTAHVQLRSILQ